MGVSSRRTRTFHIRFGYSGNIRKRTVFVEVASVTHRRLWLPAKDVTFWVKNSARSAGVTAARVKLGIRCNGTYAVKTHCVKPGAKGLASSQGTPRLIAGRFALIPPSRQNRGKRRWSENVWCVGQSSKTSLSEWHCSTHSMLSVRGRFVRPEMTWYGKPIVLAMLMARQAVSPENRTIRFKQCSGRCWARSLLKVLSF
ncbi:hypothetical protein ABIE33_003273 [Ensifer sp. 4252]